jgi:hypothetical protein
MMQDVPSSDFMNLELDNYSMRYQVDFISDESSPVIVEKGRQLNPAERK